jgi:hypothetical protein
MPWVTLALHGTVRGMRMLQLVSRGPPGDASASCLLFAPWLDSTFEDPAAKVLTIIPLSDTVLNATTLCQIRNLGPVFIGVGVRTECAAIGVTATRA